MALILNPMKLSKLFRAGIGRAVIMAFAAQVVAGAMCLMPAEAMAAPQASERSAMPVCAMKHAANSSHARHACPHCDAPVQVVSQIDITHGLQAPMPLAISAVAAAGAGGDRACRGWFPPRASWRRPIAPTDLRTTQRIRI